LGSGEMYWSLLAESWIIIRRDVVVNIATRQVLLAFCYSQRKFPNPGAQRTLGNIILNIYDAVINKIYYTLKSQYRIDLNSNLLNTNCLDSEK
jgi:hypothetical protein